MGPSASASPSVGFEAPMLSGVWGPLFKQALKHLTVLEGLFPHQAPHLRAELPKTHLQPAQECLKGASLPASIEPESLWIPGTDPAGPTPRPSGIAWGNPAAPGPNPRRTP